MRRFCLLVAFVGVLLLAACAPASSSQSTTVRKDKVHIGSVDETVSATGAVFPEERIDLVFDQPGIVTDVFAEVGQQVTAGDALARINGESYDLGVRQAELALEAQQLAYDQQLEPPSKATLAGAQAAVASAIAGYDKVNAPPDVQELQIAQYQYEQAYEAYLKAKSELDAEAGQAPASVVDIKRAALGVAINNLESARIKLEQLTSPPDENSLAAAAAGIAQAQAQLNGIKAGPGDLDVARLDAQVAQAQLALDQARQARDKATLTAPISGIVTAVNITPGMLATSAIPSIVMIDNTHLHVEVNVDEIDIGKVAVGQPVVVSFDGVPSKSVIGQITLIGSSASNNSGVVAYEVRIDLAQNDLPIRSGMTATASIIVQRLVNVLVVPNWAIRFDRETGQAYVSVIDSNNNTHDVPVILGLRSQVESQVVAGLVEGQEVGIRVDPTQLNFGAGQNENGSSAGDGQ